MFRYGKAESTLKETLDDLAAPSDDERYEYFSQLTPSEEDQESMNSGDAEPPSPEMPRGNFTL